MKNVILVLSLALAITAPAFAQDANIRPGAVELAV